MGIHRWRLASPLALATALVLVACGGGNGQGSTPPTQTGAISLGVIAPFTGPAAEFGTLLTAPCLAASDLINANGGVMGHQVNCTSIDDTGDPADAVPNVTRAI